MQEQQQQSMDNMRKRYEAANQKNLLDDYQSAIDHKKRLENVEKTIELNHAKNMEVTARQSLYHEDTKRKEILSKFKDDFKKDYEER